MKRQKLSESIGKTAIHLVFIVYSLACIIPLLLILSISISNEQELLKNGYSIIPSKIDFSAYIYIFRSPTEILNAYGITSFVTLVGTAVSIFIGSMIAYVLSQREFKYRNAITFFIFFTMLFNGGLVPWYILIRNYLNLENTVWALIVPSLVSPYYILILRTFFSKIPASLVESAKLDGAKDFYIYSSIIIPLSKPALATVGLFTALGYWNDWWHCLMFIDKYNMNSLQYLLQRIMRNIDYLYSAINTGVITIKLSDLPTESMRMAMVIMAAGPMLFLLTFLQKYFVKGLTIGAIKG